MSSKMISVFTAAAVSLVVNLAAPIAIAAVSSVALATDAHAGKKGTRKPKLVATRGNCGILQPPLCYPTGNTKSTATNIAEMNRKMAPKKSYTRTSKYKKVHIKRNVSFIGMNRKKATRK